jgi:Coenzyme PQQ synthesis protein D (PqqD).
MKLKKEFITHDTGAESLLVPTGAAAFSGLVKGNKTLGAILDALKRDITEADIVAAMKARFDAPEEIIARDVKKALSELRKIGAIDE